MKSIAGILGIMAVAGLLCGSVSARSMHSLGVGAHYFRVLGDIKDEQEFDEDGIGYNFSYRLRLGLIALEGMVQMFPDGWYNAEDAYTPKLFVLLGNNVYCGVGVMSNYVKIRDENGDTDSEWTDGSYQLRAGLELDLITDALSLDLNANYLFNNWSEVKEFDEDAMEFGVGVRVYL